MKKILQLKIVVALLLGSGLVQVSAQVLQWAKTSPSDNQCSASSFARDAAGNFFLTGAFRGTADFDPGPATLTLTTPSPDVTHIFLQKLDPEGNLLWVKTFGGEYSASATAVTVDASGDVIIAGTVGGAVDFDAGAGTLLMGGASDRSFFTAKYNADGNLIWGRSVAGNGYPGQTAGKIITDADGNIYMNGSYQGQIDFDFGDGVTLLSSTYHMYIGYLFSGFITKIGKDGNFLWAQSYGNGAHELALDPSGNVLLSGGWAGTVDFDPGPGTHNLTSVGQTGNIFVLKLTPDGNFIFVKGFRGGAIALDLAGGFYMAGNFAGDTDFDPDPDTEFILTSTTWASFIARYNIDGNLLWAKPMTASSSSSIYPVSVAPDGNVVLAGRFDEPINVDPEGAPEGELVNSSGGNQNAFLARYNADGNFIAVSSLSATQTAGIGSLKFDGQQNFYVLGGYTGTIDLDLSTQTQFNLTKNTTGYLPDYFLAKYSLAPAVNCPSGNVVISTMEQLNNFPAGCPQITGDLTVTGDAITNLSALGNLQTVTGNFTIKATGLTNLTGLSNLSNVGGTLEISSNISLTSLRGLDHNNPSGRKKSPGNLREAGTLAIQNLIITNNPVLTSCAVEFIADYLESSSATSTISDNGINGNCNSAEAIMEAWQEALPVTLTSFNARVENTVVKLEWATSAELNSDRFEVEHATNSKNWIKIGTIKGQGNSIAAYMYSFMDASPVTGLNYYRIKMLDHDGTYAYSSIRDVKIHAGNALAYMYPNPASEMLYFHQSLSGAVKKVEFFDSAGMLQLVSEYNAQKGINVGSLKPGVYAIRISSEKWDTIVQKVVISK